MIHIQKLIIFKEYLMYLLVKLFFFIKKIGAIQPEHVYNDPRIEKEKNSQTYDDLIVEATPAKFSYQPKIIEIIFLNKGKSFKEHNKERNLFQSISLLLTAIFKK